MTVEVERRPEVVTEKGVLVARSWDVFDTQGQIVVRVANPYEYPVLLEDGYPLAYFTKPEVPKDVPISLMNAEEMETEDEEDWSCAVRLLESVALATEQEVLEADPPGQSFAQDGFEDLSKQETAEQRKQRVLNTKQLAERLTPEQRVRAMELLLKYCDAFQDVPGFSTITELEINTGTAPPVTRKAYRNPLVANAGFLKQLEEWEDAGIIRRSRSAWAAPCLLVPKKNGKWRTVIDYE